MIRLGTRGSALALAQARSVAAAMIGVEVEVVPMRTEGDRLADARLAVVGGKGLFVRDIEEALLRGDIDLAAHSLKDLPAEPPAGLVLAAFPPREDARDVLVARRPFTLATLPEGARVGTSSPRRRALLLAERPDLRVGPIRGNVDTRLRKLSAGEADVIVLAAAGLARLGRLDEAGGRLDGELFVPAAGQGVIAIQARVPSPAADAAVASVNHAATMACLQAERAAVRALGASCHAPVGVSARLVAESLQIRGFAGLPDGSEWVLDEHAAVVAEPEEAGRELARRMQLAGAGDVLRRAEEAAA